MDKELLFKPRCPEEDVELPGVGTVRVRGFMRAEVKMLGEIRDSGRDTDPWCLSRCLVDPTLSEEEAALWLEAAPFGEIETIIETINRLSGFDKLAAKEAYKSLRGES